jgi:hypothetical protein
MDGGSKGGYGLKPPYLLKINRYISKLFYIFGRKNDKEGRERREWR